MGMSEFDRAQLTTESTVVVRNPPSSLNMGSRGVCVWYRNGGARFVVSPFSLSTET